MDEFDTYPAGLLEMLGVDREKMRQQQMTQGLLSAGLQLLAGSGYSPVRRTTGELLGQAGVAGLGAYQQAGESSIDRALKGMQVKQMMDKQKREAQFAESIRNAYRMAPTTTGIGQQQEAALMAQMQFPGEEAPQAQDVNLTRQALLSNQGLPQERVLDQQKFMSALAEYNPLEYAKMMFKEDKVPDAIRTLEILNKRPDLLKTELERRRAESAQINLPGKTQLELMSEVYAPQVKVAFDEAKQARDFANSASTVANLLKGKGGGEMVRIGTVLSRNLGLGDKETVAAADLAESLATRGAVSMRAPGSGSTSDIEFTAYREAFPSLRNSDDGRQLMAKYAGKFADRAEKIADYKAKLLASGQYSLEAVRKYDESLGPVLGEDFYKFKPTQSGGGTRDYRGGR